MNPKVVVVIVTWNNEQDIVACIQSLQKQDYADFKIVVVDNNSQDKTVQIVQQFPQVEVLAQSQNLFFAKGNNLGTEYAVKTYQPDFIALLNPDTEVASNWISSQIKLMQSHKQVGVIGPKVLFAEGFGIEVAKTNSEMKVINTVGLLPGGFLFPYDRGFGEVDHGQYDKQEEVFGLCGVSLFIRTEAIKQVGLFFEPLEMYLEDADLCARLRRAHWQILYTPDTYVWHKHMRSTSKQPSNFYLVKSHRNYMVYVWRNFGTKKFLRAWWEVFRKLNLGNFIQVTFQAWWLMLLSLFTNQKRSFI